MRTYYRGPDAHVTDEHFVWRTETSRVFVVRHLRDVVVVRRVRSDRGPDVAMLVAAVVATMAVAGWLVAGVVAGAALGVVAVTVAAGAAATRRHRPNHYWQLRATCGGVEVVLFEAADERVFNQVKRALRRALEGSAASGEERRLTAA